MPTESTIGPVTEKGLADTLAHRPCEGWTALALTYDLRLSASDGRMAMVSIERTYFEIPEGRKRRVRRTETILRSYAMGYSAWCSLRDVIAPQGCIVTERERLRGE